MAPTTQKALVLPAAKAPFQLVADWPVPKPGPSDILVKLVSAALNPVDAYIKALGGGPLVSKYPLVLGFDGAGVVEEVGPEVTHVAKGDGVLVSREFGDNRATFKEYLTYPASELVKSTSLSTRRPRSPSPSQRLSPPSGHPEKARNPSVSPRHGKRAGRPSTQARPRSSSAGRPPSASSPVIQCARMQGFSPIIATSSPRNASFLKSLGATDVLDRSLPPSDIKHALSSLAGGKPIEYVYDAWGRDGESARVGYSVLAPGGAFATVNPRELTDIADLVEESEKKAGEGKRIAQAWGSYNVPGNKELGEAIYKRLTGWLETGAIVPNRVEVLPNGLAGVEAGLERMLKGQVSGVKLVVHISETP